MSGYSEIRYEQDLTPAVQRLKAGLCPALDPDWRELGAWVSDSLAQLFATEENREGVAAFLEKRPPRHQGR